MARWPAAEQPLAPLFHQDVSIDSNGFIPCGVCSVAFEERAGRPDIAWAICPHRLLTFGPEGFSAHQHDLGYRVLRLAGFDSGAVVDVWSEITLRDVATNVNYRLDYVLKGVTSDAPPVIVEVMTASTSGGNNKKGTDIQSAFCNAVLYAYNLVPELSASPGVNARQVWARMASQLIVKSEVANAWGGRAIWVIQDSLMEYIRKNTGLDLEALRSEEWTPGEVNVVVAGLEETGEIELYAGPIRREGNRPCWSDLLGAPGLPVVDRLLQKLAKKDKVATLQV